MKECRGVEVVQFHTFLTSTADGQLTPRPLYTQGKQPPVLIECTVLQIGRSLVRFQTVSMNFSIDIILLIALWPWGRLSL
jgi:hypothetical protein